MHISKLCLRDERTNRRRESNSVPFSRKIWRMVAIILVIFLIIKFRAFIGWFRFFLSPLNFYESRFVLPVGGTLPTDTADKETCLCPSVRSFFPLLDDTIAQIPPGSSRHDSTRVERVETSVSSHAVRQARHRQNTWARHVERVESCRVETWRDEPSGIWAYAVGVEILTLHRTLVHRRGHYIKSELLWSNTLLPSSVYIVSLFCRLSSDFPDVAVTFCTTLCVCVCVCAFVSHATVLTVATTCCHYRCYYENCGRPLNRLAS